MKRIAIIGNAFGGSTTSLAEAFLNQGYKVDFYHLTSRKKSVSYEAFDLPLRGSLFSIVPVDSFDYDGLRRFHLPEINVSQCIKYQLLIYP